MYSFNEVKINQKFFPKKLLILLKMNALNILNVLITECFKAVT